MGAGLVLACIWWVHAWFTAKPPPRIVGSWSLYWEESVPPEVLRIVSVPGADDLYDLEFTRHCAAADPQVFRTEARLTGSVLTLTLPYELCGTRFPSLSAREDSGLWWLIPNDIAPPAWPWLMYYVRERG